MIAKQGVALTFYAFFTESKVGKTGLTVTVDVYEGTNATPIVSGAAATEQAGGLYRYTLAGASNDANGAYIAVFKTATTSVDQQHLPAIWTIGTIISSAVTTLETAAVNQINATVDTAIADASLATGASLTTVAAAVTAIKTVTDLLPDGGALTALLASVASILADTGTDGVVLSTSTQQAIADAVLGRSAANVESTAGIHSLAALIFGAFESSIAGTTWTLYESDGVTVFATREITATAGANPITGVS